MNNEQPIYKILCFEHPNKEAVTENGKLMGLPDMGDKDDVGFYYEKETAIRALHENWCDIQDCCYHAAFLITQKPGIYQFATKQNRTYFVWNQEKEGFFEQEEPEIFKHFAF